jgi:hypothetical protein
MIPKERASAGRSVRLLTLVLPSINNAKSQKHAVSKTKARKYDYKNEKNTKAKMKKIATKINIIRRRSQNATQNTTQPHKLGTKDEPGGTEQERKVGRYM